MLIMSVQIRSLIGGLRGQFNLSIGVDVHQHKREEPQPDHHHEILDEVGGRAALAVPYRDATAVPARAIG